jgi:type IV pilus assembly protein PilE
VKKALGFSLIEMMVTLAIVGILATIAYPSYQASAMKTRRTDAIAAVLSIQVAQEKFRGSCPFYAQSLGGSNTCGSTAALSTVQAGATSVEGYYTLSIQANSASGNAYTIVADPTGIQVVDTDCDPMSIAYSGSNPTGLKAPAACW